MKLLATLIIATTACATGASAKDKCNVPVSEWQPRKLLQSKLEGNGWKVRSIRAEDGCYEALAVNAKGEDVAALFNPKSLEAVEMQAAH